MPPHYVPLTMMTMMLLISGGVSQTVTDYLPIAETITSDFTIAGYRFSSNAMNQSFMDLDLKSLINAQTTNMAMNVYQDGGNSMVASGEMRTMQNLAYDTGLGDMFDKLSMYNAFWTAGFAQQIDAIVLGALQGTGNYSGCSNTYRLNVVSTVSQGTILWMQSLHELNDEINICLGGGNFNVNENVNCWDEAFAFYAGSSIGADGTTQGYAMYSLIQQMCSTYGSCRADQISVNQRLLAAFSAGQAASRVRDCPTMQQSSKTIATLFTVPLMQATLLYARMVDPKIPCPSCSQDRAVEAGKLWGYATALMPYISKCNGHVGAMLLTNTHPKSFSAGTVMSVGFDSFVSSLQSTFTCLGISCSDVGGTTMGILACTDVSSSSSSSPSCYSLNNGASVTGIVFAVLALFVIFGVVVSYLTRAHRLRMMKTYNNTDGDEMNLPQRQQVQHAGRVGLV